MQTTATRREALTRRNQNDENYDAVDIRKDGI